MAKAKSKSAKPVKPGKKIENGQMSPPPPGAHDGEKKYGFGLGITIGILLGLFLGTGTLLFFELQRKDVLENVQTSIEKQMEVNNIPKSSTDASLPKVLPDNGLDQSISPQNTSGTPEVFQTSPLDNARDVPADAEISISFTASMDPDTLSKDTISVFSTDDLDDISDQMTFNYREESRQLTINFLDSTADFGSENIIEVVLTTKVKNIEGKSLEESFKLKFVTL